MEDVFCIVPHVVKEIDFFDLKSLCAVNKSMETIIKANATVNQSYDMRLYVLLYDTFVNRFGFDNDFGLKLSFRGCKRYEYDDNLEGIYNTLDLDEVFMIGISRALGKEPLIYYTSTMSTDNSEKRFECFERKGNMSVNRDDIKASITHMCNKDIVREVDVKYHNMLNKDFDTFLCQLLQLVSIGFPNASVYIERGNFPENALVQFCPNRVT